ncbi:hypothetical protein CDD80_1399 [Ophiocordyceps camponoti-rufipedis]|uniref:Uncharacterized protein n=1 Tax=Ophiocordyceps camponoti-rufipedis TaxID=2004952 RepID=A0A2C5Y4Y9_9HYPO|nr:hypothetical protein CDD80_1399 [Ophiocordyceps camponoti-rufipedis]
MHLHSPSSDPAETPDPDRALTLLVHGSAAAKLIHAFLSSLDHRTETIDLDDAHVLALGLAALETFLQINVTGPVVAASSLSALRSRFLADAFPTIRRLRTACVSHLQVDAVSPYPHASHLELFALARYALAHVSDAKLEADGVGVAWWRLRINVWHYKLLTQPSLGSGSIFAKSSQWTDVPSLTTSILDGMSALYADICGDEVWSDAVVAHHDLRHGFLVEAAANYILLGCRDEAEKSIREAARAGGFVYALTGALGKRTRFQEKSTRDCL